jgi:hypothetical protein
MVFVAEQTSNEENQEILASISNAVMPEYRKKVSPASASLLVRYRCMVMDYSGIAQL